MATVLLGSCTAPEAGGEADRRVRVIQSGAVYAGRNAELSQLPELGALGIRTMLDLDQEHWAERRRVPRDHAIARNQGILFVHLPLDPVTAPSLAELHSAVNILRERRLQPILVHADHSDHRTRLVIAAYRIRVQGWSPESAAGEMARNSRLAPWFQAWKDRLFEYAAVQRAGVAPGQASP